MKIKDWQEYLNREIPCSCSKEHRCDIDEILIEAGALKKLPDILSRYNYQNICVVSDIHTEQVAGKTVSALLNENGYQYTKVVFPEDELIPDERILGSLLVDLPQNCDLILAVGSGTINDLCKFISYKLNIDYFILATAPAMDGFASNVAPLIVKNLKTTYEVGKPKVIIGDLEILKEAPISMIAAGAGDILGKYVCLADWKLAHLVTGEYYCEYVESLIRSSIEAVVSAISRVKERDEEAIGSIMEGLVLSGIAMSYVGNSRPASGSEHHLSHYWEMMSLFGGSHGALHGTKVGIGTVLGLRMYEKLGEKLDNLKEKSASFHRDAWDQLIREAYRQAAPQVILLENQVHKNADDAVHSRVNELEKHKEEIRKMIAALPKADEIAGMLKEMDAPFQPAQIGVDHKTLKNSVLYAKELRNRFGLLQFLFDTGELEEMSELAVREFSCQN
ncbi:sn-glycerol-1-phosphate dehydrogenase [Robinsoniella peoriensis]|uniref:sn-glycerol-1-phosphate dehydrogenase n=1 Tax=Robinsoniella peoriensis TaxID=180332 RepID=UPI003751889F